MLALGGWLAFCGLRYWLAVNRAKECQGYLENAGTAGMADIAMRCLADATASRDNAILWAAGVPLTLVIFLLVFVWFIRAQVAKDGPNK